MKMKQNLLASYLKKSHKVLFLRKHLNKILFCVFVCILYLVLKKYKTETQLHCLINADGACRLVKNITEKEELNKQHPDQNPMWQVAPRSECEYVKKLNQIRFCKSSCEKVWRRDFSDFQKRKEKTVCVADEVTNMCEVFTTLAQAVAQYCNERTRGNTFVTQDFRCTLQGLSKPGQTGQCAF